MQNTRLLTSWMPLFSWPLFWWLPAPNFLSSPVVWLGAKDATLPDALHNRPSVVSPQVAEADLRTGLHMPSISFATFGFFASHCDIDVSEVVARSPAPAASAFCT